MDPTLLALIALVFGLALGYFLGHRFGSTSAKDWQARHGERDAEARELSEKLSRMTPELATMSERAARADALSETLDKAREELAALKAERAGFEEQKRLLEESRANLLKEFENTGAKVLGAAQERFLERANERLGHSEKSSEEKLKALLDPVGKRLEAYEKQVAALEEKRTDAFGRLYQQITEMQRGQEEVRREAQRLGNSLTNAPKARGRWGERALQNVLEQCGLSEHTDFQLEHSIETDEGRLRPDAVVHVPGQKKLVIDAKVSLNAYQAAFEADEEGERVRHLDLHAKSMRNHVQTLGSKSYQSQFDDTPDYVVMFVPGEQPTNLVAIARTVAQVWRQDKMAEEAKDIGRLGAELYDRLAKVTEDLGKMGTHLGRAVSSYNDFTRSFESRVLVSARKMQDKGIEIGKREIADVDMIEANPRPPETAQIEDRRDAAE